MGIYRFSVHKGHGSASVMEEELRDKDAARTRAAEVARVLLEEAQSMKRLVDYDLLRVSDEDGNVVVAGLLKELTAKRRPALVDITDQVVTR